MDRRVEDYMRKKFGNKLFKKLSPVQNEDFTKVMYTLLFSHQHKKKKVAFLNQYQLIFDTVRNPAYKYSQKVETEYFEHDREGQMWSFLMVYFAEM